MKSRMAVEISFRQFLLKTLPNHLQIYVLAENFALLSAKFSVELLQTNNIINYSGERTWIMDNLATKLDIYFKAGLPILFLHTFEERKAVQIIQTVAGQRALMEWSALGFRSAQGDVEFEEFDLLTTLNLLLADTDVLNNKILILRDAHYYFQTPDIIARLKYLAQIAGEKNFNIVVIAPVMEIPKELNYYISVLYLDFLTIDEIQDLINAYCDEHNTPRLDNEFLQELSVTFKGLSEYEIKSILGIALSDDGVIDRNDLEMIFGQKQQLIQKSGILEMVPLKEGLEDIGGLESLKSWLQRKQKIFKNIRKAKQFGVSVPKGVLIAGMPGCGKSLNAKAAAKLFGVPLLRLDMGRLMGKYVGESEANMRKAIILAEAISPCVLWIDELEKSFAGVGGDGAANDISTRLFGTFLTWLQEKDSLAFVVATANNIVKLPPELLRKGRFDEIFYVGLPNEAERKKIFSIHIKKRRPVDLQSINLDKLVKLTKGYSGADIEGVVRDGVEEAFTKGKNCLETEDIILAINNTHSLSEIMKDSLDIISKIYHDRKFKNASV
jgi:AAA+ superfamily predicted ATPase